MYREKIFGVAVKIETTSGVDSVPTAAANAIRVIGIPTLEWGYIENGERPDVQNGQMGAADASPPAGRWFKITLPVEVKGGGAAGSAPEYDALMLMSGHSKTVSAGVSVLYSTLDDNMQTGSVYMWGAGKLFKGIGAVATLKLQADMMKRGVKTFEVSGVMASDPVDAATPALTLSTVVPSLFVGGSVSLGAWTSAAVSDPLVLKSASIDEGIVVNDRGGAGAADGLIGYLITDRLARQTMVVEVPQLATFDFVSVVKSGGATAPLAAWQIGTVVGNRCKVQTGRFRFQAPKYGAMGGVNTMSLEGPLAIGAAPTSNREINYLYD